MMVGGNLYSDALGEDEERDSYQEVFLVQCQYDSKRNKKKPNNKKTT